MNWTPLHGHSHHSLLDGFGKNKDIVNKCSELGYKSCALTDHGNIAGSIGFHKEAKKAGIKPILGCELYISRMDAKIKDKNNAQRNMDHLVVLAKNKQGWKSLISAVSRSNDEDVYYYKPRLDNSLLSEYTSEGNIVGFSGHMGSQLASCMFNDKGEWVSDPLGDATNLALKLQDIFGKGNFWIEIQLICAGKKGAKIAEVLREVSKKTGIPCVATADSHYVNRSDAVDQRLILCSSLKTTFKKVEAALKSDGGFGLSGFFENDFFHMPSLDEMKELHTEEELANSMEIADLCEDYDVLGKPKLPHFPCPDGMDEGEYLKELCRKGWADKLYKRNIFEKGSDLEKTYLNRLETEFNVFKEAGLEGYFLIVQDYVNWAKDQGWLVGPGRGSGAGCLVSFLTGITLIDPIPHDLLFSRFYNAGRNTEDNVAFPDIDVDFPIEKRGEIIEYIKNKYGHNQVCQMATFSRLQGRGALREVLRVHDVCSFNMINEITKNIPHEAQIDDQMTALGETSIIRYVLENDPKLVSDYCVIDDDGKLSGEYAQYFEQAIRIEGTYKSQGKHAAGLVISAENLNEVCPMVRDAKGEDKIAGVEMNILEAMGHIKFDILGLRTLDKLMEINNLLKG